MKKVYSFVVALLLLTTPFVVSAQRNGIVRCLTTEKEAIRRAKGLAVPIEQFEKVLAKEIAKRKKSRTPTVRYDVPIVYHIIHSDATKNTFTANNNLANQYIVAQNDQLNADFQRTNSDANQTYAGNAAFESHLIHAGGLDIHFNLARVDPNGTVMAEPGVDRVYYVDKGFTAPPYDGQNGTYIDDVIKPNTVWDPNKYINVWLMDLAGGLLGYAQFPDDSGLEGMPENSDPPQSAATDGVVCRITSAGSIAIPNPSGGDFGLGRTLTHELGHWAGLRHIWGDLLPAPCAAPDYADDTPDQAKDNLGCSASGSTPLQHPKPACLPGQAEMFENYMDYTDDFCMNLFTKDQMTRVATVMTVSPRRKELTTSTTADAPGGIANTISFATTTATLSETSTAPTCPQFTDVVLTVKMVTAGAATGAATVNITTAGTATNGKDYQIIPSTLTYATGQTDKTVTLRIFDDGEVESNETIILGFNITGTGVAAGGANQTYTATIVSDDKGETAIANLIDENWESLPATLTGPVSSKALPTGWARSGNTGTLNTWIIGEKGGMNGTYSAYVSDTSAVGVATTGARTPGYANSTPGGSDNVRLRTPVVNATGYKNLRLIFDFKANAEKNAAGTTYYDIAVVEYALLATPTTYVLYKSAGTAAAPTSTPFENAAKTTFNDALPAALEGQQFYIYFRWKNDLTGQVSPPFTIDDIKVTGEQLVIASATNQQNTKTFAPSQTVFFPDATTSALLAKIQNTSATHDYGCTETKITRGGTSAQTFWNTNNSNKIFDKVFKVTPATNNATGTYKVRFYLTNTEVSNWQTATGKNFLSDNVIIYKAQGDITTITPGNPNTAGSIEKSTSTTRGQIGTSGYYIEGNFTTGFSTFAIGMNSTPDVALNAELVEFKGENVKGIGNQLTWVLASEINNNYFTVEKSRDGKVFETIGEVKSLGDIQSSRTYNFMDKEAVAGVNYYRLSQTDLDGTKRQYNTITVNTAFEKLGVAISPNPSNGLFNVQLNRFDTKNVVTAKIFNALGMQVQNVTFSSQNAVIDLSSFQNGVYILSVESGKNVVTQRLVKM